MTFTSEIIAFTCKSHNLLPQSVDMMIPTVQHCSNLQRLRLQCLESWRSVHELTLKQNTKFVQHPPDEATICNQLKINWLPAVQ